MNCGHTRDPDIYSRFHRNPFRSFGTQEGQNLPFPITLAIGFYNSLYYRTSRDVFGEVTKSRTSTPRPIGLCSERIETLMGIS